MEVYQGTGTTAEERAEQQAWAGALEEYMIENPSDWIAKWLYGGMESGMWEESMYADILRDWYGSVRPPRRGYLRREQPFMPEPAWMSEAGLIAERGEDIRGSMIEGAFEELREKYPAVLGGGWWRSIPEEELAAAYQYAPGQAESLRPMGAQLNLTTEQLDQLMYYQAYLKGGKPESRKEYLETVAYKMPGWIQDYISESRATWPTVAPPRATTRAAWQR